MSGRILVLGAAGRLGRTAAGAFRDGGWTVVSLVRAGRARLAPAGTQIVELDALDHAAVGKAARGADVVLHALNPPFTQWSRLALPLAYSAISAAETSGATLLFPANLYNFGSPLPLLVSENTPMRPSSRKGQLRVAMEDRIAEAAERGVRAIIVRAGDFYGRGHGTWFDLVLTKELSRGRVTYPGPLDVTHEWAYLPDFAAALLRVANRRETLPQFASFGFPGHAVTGRELTVAIARALRDKIEVKRMTWWLIHALRPIVPLCRELSEVAYLWNEPHRVDGSKLAAAIGEIARTPLDLAVARALQDVGATV
jgi:nucleoside-diphosphate-sugar epimerase